MNIPQLLESICCACATMTIFWLLAFRYRNSAKRRLVRQKKAINGFGALRTTLEEGITDPAPVFGSLSQFVRLSNHEKQN